MRITRLITISAASLAIFAAPTSFAKEFYAGKRIEVFLPVPAGGGLDRNARVFMKTFPNHIPGNPTIVIKNMPGGGGQRGINHVFAKGGNKGLRLVWGPMNFAGILAGLPGIRYKPEEFKPVGVFSTPFVTIARNDLVPGGMKSPEDIMKVKDVFVNGGRIPGGSLGTYGILSYNMLGLKYRHSIGYRNQPKLKAAIIQKEIQSLSTGNPGFWVFYANDLIKKGTARALFYHPLFDLRANKMTRHPDFYGKGVLAFEEFYAKVKGKPMAGPTAEVYKWWSAYQRWSMWVMAPPKTPAPALAILRAAYGKNVVDPAFLKRFKKGNRRAPDFLVGKDAELVSKGYKKISKTAQAELKKILNVGRK